MTKANILISLVEEISQPRRIYVAGKKNKIHKSQILKEVADWIERTNWGLDKENSEKVASMYLFNRLFHAVDKQGDPIPPDHLLKTYNYSKAFGYDTASRLLKALESKFKKYRVFFDDNPGVEWVYVQGNRVTSAQEDGEKK
jgi:hypothetical protein